MSEGTARAGTCVLREKDWPQPVAGIQLLPTYSAA